MMARIPKNFTVKQDGTGKITIERKAWGKLDASAQIRMKKSKRVRVQRPQINFGKRFDP